MRGTKITSGFVAAFAVGVVTLLITRDIGFAILLTFLGFAFALILALLMAELNKN